MDLKVIDTTIHPLYSRIAPDKPLPPDPGGAGFSLPTDDAGRLLAYALEGQTAITKALDELHLTYQVLPEDQPDPTLLAACQGKVKTRSEALAAIAAGSPPPTLESLAADVKALKDAKPVAAK